MSLAANVGRAKAIRQISRIFKQIRLFNLLSVSLWAGTTQMHLAARLAVQNFAPDRRRSTRYDLAKDATLAWTGFHGADVVVTDISLSGFRARLGRHIPPGSIIRLKMAGIGMVVARIVWSKNGDVGGAFINPISEQRLRQSVGLRAG